MKAAIRYYGGKGNMFNEILKEFPEAGSYNCYIEPFAGAYSVGLQMEYLPTTEIYNDLNQNVYALHKVLSDAELFVQFKEKCDLAYYSEDLRSEYKVKLKDDSISDLDRAFMFFYVNRTSHNGNGGFSMNVSPRRNMSKSISDYLSTIDRLPELHQRLSRVIVTNRDGIKLIEKFMDNENTFIYCDPPYCHCTRTGARYETDMSDEQQIAFVDVCCKAKCKLLISGYDNDLYEKLVENGFKKMSFDVETMSQKFTKKTKVETLWKNY